MSDPSKPFRAGFINGLRSYWGLEKMFQLEVLRNEASDDYDAGHSAGWFAGETQSPILNASELLPVVYAAWISYAEK